MNTSDYHFILPESLIAQYPLPNRADSRLLYYSRSTKSHAHQGFKDLITLLEPGDLLVMNNSKVIPARFFGTKETGGKVEFLIERVLNDHQFMTHIRASKALKPGMLVHLEQDWCIRVLEKKQDLYFCEIELSSKGAELLRPIDTMLDTIGHIPLPLYITREDETFDKARYQTVYAKHQGSVAAPTAGLHFDKALLDQLDAQGINRAYSTLHVGAGTFRPVRTEALVDHVMHSEYCVVDHALCQAVNDTKAANKRVIAVGTTAMRSLETAAQSGFLKPFEGDTNIFIYSGYQFKICDGLLTNFHLPESTLLMLVSAFVGHSETMALYQEAILQGYRFYSYGDACLFL